MSKHTPGPWYVDTEYPIQIVKHMEHLVGTSKCAEYVVADISEGAFMGEEELANARLIAAAPDMYTLLRSMVEIFEGYDAEADCDPFAAKEFFVNLAEEFLVDAHEILLAVDGETK